MSFWVVLIAVLISSECHSVVNRSNGVKYDDGFDTARQSGYFARSTKEQDYGRTRQNSVVRGSEKIGHRSGGSVKDGPADGGPLILVNPTGSVFIDEDMSREFSVERQKNGTNLAVPLHVADTARQQCMEGYQVDENGTCQKVLPPKDEKSFKLRRRKRAEQKLSYADVVKYGRNPPKNLTVKADVLTTTQRTIEAKKNATTIPPATRSAVTTPPVVVHPATAATVKPAVVAVTTVKPGGTVQPTAKPAAVPAVTANPATKASPTTKPAGRFGDINQAFLLGEKASVVAQSMGGVGKPSPVGGKKTVDPTRLRRSIFYLSA